MPVVRDRPGHGEGVGVQAGEEGPFLQRGEARQVHPGGAFGGFLAGGRSGAVVSVVSVAARGGQVVPVRLDAAEGDAAQPVDLQRVLHFFSTLSSFCPSRVWWNGARGRRRRNGHDVALLARADLVADAVDDVALAVRVQCQVVEPAVREPEARVLGVRDGGDQPGFGEGPEGLLQVAVGGDLGELLDQGKGDEEVRARAELDLELPKGEVLVCGRNGRGIGRGGEGAYGVQNAPVVSV